MQTKRRAPGILSLRYHPTASERLEILQKPEGLFKTTQDLPFIAGLLLGFVTTGLDPIYFQISGLVITWNSVIVDKLIPLVGENLLLTSLTYVFIVEGRLATLGFYLLICLGLGYLLAGTVGLQVQRQAIAALAIGKQGCPLHLRLAALAILFTVGMELGALITPPYTFSPLGTLIGGLVDPVILLLLIPWELLFAFFTWLVLLFNRFLAAKLLGGHLGAMSPTGKRRATTLLVSLLAGLLFLPLFAGHDMILYPYPEGSEILQGVFLIGLIVGVSIFGLAFSGTWLLFTSRLRLRPLICPSCHNVTRAPSAVGQSCKDCHQSLAAWLYITQSSTPANHV